ncbi:TraX family protein [Anaerocolumna sp. MB42-C2]|uniref:TraX family protein n=1 Tax=Anaerocolumna sp. MB42-C2 TaxID=3070997 RepID=UPI0027DF88D8|nr:TraX family protein [Anaerocolumna sp. MB42-C2]WMJ89869.1 TraX family protein [Anaerocolumna sp. MB42-C2]
MNHHKLKIFALFAMFFDHTVRIFPLQELFSPICDELTSQGYEQLGMWILIWLPRVLNYIGRFAAPIFLFCLVEGFVHTANIKRYFGRILLTAIAAQGPYIMFDLAENRLIGLTGNWRECGLNILFTLGLGLLALSAFNYLYQRGHTLFGISVVALAGVLARLLQLEGHEGYIFIIFTFYLLRNTKTTTKILVFIPVILLSRYRLVAYTLTDNRMFQSCILNVLGNYLGVLITCFYSGEKGKSGRKFQLFMYAFYPVHLLLLAIIGYLRPLF